VTLGDGLGSVGGERYRPACLSYSPKSYRVSLKVMTKHSLLIALTEHG